MIENHIRSIVYSLLSFTAGHIFLTPLTSPKLPSQKWSQPRNGLILNSTSHHHTERVGWRRGQVISTQLV
jgi:hypothetical protein